MTHFLSRRAPPALGRTVQVESRTDESKVTKSLRRITELVTAAGNLLRKHGQMVGKAQHVLEYVDCPHEVFVLVNTRARHGLHQPKRTHAECAVSSPEAYKHSSANGTQEVT